MENSAIEWTDHTFNPWWGCQKVSPACKHCYAEGVANRFGGDTPLWGPGSARRISSGRVWSQPLRWHDRAEKAGIREKVFCASMADIFEDRRDLDEPRAWLFAMIEATPALDWLLLTKRPENILELGCPNLPNIWLGATMERQEYYDERLPFLIAARDALDQVPVIFASCEPLLGPIDLDTSGEGLDWVIAGGESGPGARATPLHWFRWLRNACALFGIPFFFKQWGEHDELLRPVGKKVSGAELDGVLHRTFPA